MSTTPVHFELAVGPRRISVQSEVPAEPTRPRVLLPVLRDLAERIVDIGVQAVESEGQSISCTRGCGACCRQLVPIAAAEAHHLRELVAALPVGPRRLVRERFAAARRRLSAGGLLQPLLRAMDGQHEGPLRPLGERYFQLGIACPFLVDESCSIHTERPIVCREYLVTSPAERCAAPTPESIDVVPIAARVGNAVAALDAPVEGGRGRWVPLVLALEWAERNPEGPPQRTGPEILGSVLRHLTA